MKEKKLFIIGAILVVLGLILSYFFLIKKDDNKIDDAKKFKSEYTNVTSDNPFVYRNVDQIINILEKGTGVVYLGFPECPWCQAYVPYVEEVAKKVGIDKVYYFNIKDDRKNNTEEYQKIVKILDVYLSNDDEGNKKIYVPAIIAVNKGEIVGFDDETAWDTKGFEDPKDYWTEDKVTALKTKLSKMIEDSGSNSCSDCNK